MSLRERVNARAWQATGVLEVHCDLPGSKPVTEGIRLSVLTFKFVQESGATLFHVLQD